MFVYRLSREKYKDKLSGYGASLNGQRWNSIPCQPNSQIIGDKFIEESIYAVLKVPGAVVKGEFNFILNPKHKDFKKIIT